MCQHASLTTLDFLDTMHLTFACHPNHNSWTSDMMYNLVRGRERNQVTPVIFINNVITPVEIASFLQTHKITQIVNMKSMNSVEGHQPSINHCHLVVKVTAWQWLLYCEGPLHNREIASPQNCSPFLVMFLPKSTGNRCGK